MSNKYLKKVLILNSKTHTELGGIETYSHKLINLFLKNGYQVFELSQQPVVSEKKINSTLGQYIFVNHNFYKKTKIKKTILPFYNSFLLYITSVKVNKLHKKLVKKYKIPIVIDNNFSIKISFCKNTKYFWVQHFDAETIKDSFLKRIIKKILLIKNRFNFPAIITYTQKNIDYLIKNKLVNPKKSKIYSIVPGIIIPSNTHTHTQTSSEIAFIGRLDNNQKNIQFLNEITKVANKNNEKITIHVYGNGPDKILIENNPNIILHNAFKQEHISEILSKIKVLLLPSKFEGFALVVAEALCHGIPCIVADTYLNANFLIDNSRGKLIKNFNSDEWYKAISTIINLSKEEYKQLSNNCIKFAKEHLSLEQFENKWLKAIENELKI